MEPAARRALDNLAEWWRTIAEHADGAACAEGDAVLSVRQRRPAGWYDGTFVLTEPRDLKATAARLRRVARDRSIVARVWHEYAPEVAAAVGARVDDWALPVMTHRAPATLAIPGLDGVVIERVTEPDDVAAANAVLAGVWDAEPDEHRDFLTPRLASHIAHLAGRVGDTVIACAMGFAPAGSATAGVYNVAVDQAHRRSGLGTAMTVAAAVTGDAASASEVTLQASPMGRPVYERLGFETLGRLVILEIPAADSDH